MLVIGLVLLLIGVWALVSPSSFMTTMAKAPKEIGNLVYGDMMFGGIDRSWAYMIGGGVLLFFGNWIKDR